MDSMRTLNTSLPRSPRRRLSASPPEQLIQTFKSAALAVTNLYRTAEANEHRSREAGYQDALDDLLAFLDKENIGLCDGEGWRVRQWATERLDDQPPFQGGSESEEERIELVNPARSASPTIHDKSTPQTSNPPKQEAATSPFIKSLRLDGQQTALQENLSYQAPDVFTFRASHPFPQDTDIQPPDVATVDLARADNTVESRSPPAITVNVHQRNTKLARSNRHSARSSAARGLGTGAGSKRRAPFGEFFDVANLDGSGANKRGRLG